MLKKRLIFTLLYNNGQFMLSRNFRLQKVGDLGWLQTNYDFSKISFSIDEIVVLDVTRGVRDLDRFCDSMRALAENCFVPIAAGGGVGDIASARALLRSGADKIVVNSVIAEAPSSVVTLAREFGQQCIVASVDLRRDSDGDLQVLTKSGSRPEMESAYAYLSRLAEMPVGELYLNSIDRDGTGQGLDLSLLDVLPKALTQPVILAGGIGNASHMYQGLTDNRLDAVATAHLFNFVGDGLIRARQALIKDGIALAFWDLDILSRLEVNRWRGIH